MTGETVALVLGTGATVGATIAVAGRWVVSVLIREDVQPLRETMLSLRQTVESLVTEMRDAKAEQKEGRDELHDAVEAIRSVLANHETRITVLEGPAPQARKMRVAR
jgi:hypothetical protein